MNAFAVRTAPARLLFWPVTLVALALVAMGTGVAPVIALVGLLGLAALLAAPMQTVAIALLGFSLLVDNPGERPMDGLWDSPVSAAGALLYENLHRHTGIAALRFSALELLIALLVGIVVYRKVQGDPIDDPLALGALPSPMKTAFALFFVALVSLEIYGLARGGDFRNSLFQFRQLFWLPLLGVLFGHAFRHPGARPALLRTLMAVAWLRCAVGAYFHFVVCCSPGRIPEYAMTHSDSILIVVAMFIGLTALAERASHAHIALNVLLQPMLLVGLIVNNRRLAFVSLAAGIAVLILMGPPSLLRFLKRSLVVIVPLTALYVAVGWNSTAGIFKPVSMIRSVTSQTDTSSQTRDIENYNLIHTLKQRPVFGSGFGHEYIEISKAYSIDHYFAQYRYIAHNSVLWLLSISGWAGFSLLWAVFPVALLVSLRAHRRSTTVIDRVTALATAAAVLSFVLQAWGDMGLQSWMGTLVVTSLMGASGSMFTEQGRMEMTA